MPNFSYYRGLFWGFVSYAAVFYLWTFLSSYGLSHGLAAQVIGYVVAFAAVCGASYAVGITTFFDAVKYGLSFAAMHIALDALVIIPTIGVEAFYSPSVWIGYAIVFITPFAFLAYSKVAQRATSTTEPVAQ